MTTLTPARLMARNYEKRFTGLNRFLEAGQKAKGAYLTLPHIITMSL